MGSPRVAIGAPPDDGRHWRLVDGPMPMPMNRPIWLCAERLGFLASVEVRVDPA